MKTIFAVLALSLSGCGVEAAGMEADAGAPDAGCLIPAIVTDCLKSGDPAAKCCYANGHDEPPVATCGVCSL